MYGTTFSSIDRSKTNPFVLVFNSAYLRESRISPLVVRYRSAFYSDRLEEKTGDNERREKRFTDCASPLGEDCSYWNPHRSPRLVSMSELWTVVLRIWPTSSDVTSGEIGSIEQSNAQRRLTWSRVAPKTWNEQQQQKKMIQDRDISFSIAFAVKTRMWTG